MSMIANNHHRISAYIPTVRWELAHQGLLSNRLLESGVEPLSGASKTINYHYYGLIEISLCAHSPPFDPLPVPPPSLPLSPLSGQARDSAVNYDRPMTRGHAHQLALVCQY